ncbi:MAG: KilA-N domain-containing protein [Clostridiales bacterium]|jgi:hypothetical protein|nr:KilA-N domain-containing protein [Clostridiales bacterium]
MPKDKTIIVKGIDVRYNRYNQNDYLSLTDIAKFKNAENPNDVIKNWLRNRMTIEFLGIWESLYNPDFNPVEFDGFRNETLLNVNVKHEKLLALPEDKWLKS